MSNVSKLITDSIAEVYENKHPQLAAHIKTLVARGESYGNFFLYIKRKFGKEYKTSLTATASLTLFKHYAKSKVVCISRLERTEVKN